jgi:AcrR family transcriptional regulator
MGTAERRRREYVAREEDLKRAAIALFDRDDWERVTIDEIARRAEHAKGTVYRHFASKDDLYAHIAIDHAEETFRRLTAVPTDLPFEEAVAALVAVYWDRFTRDRATARLAHYVQRDDFLPRLPEETRRRMREADARHLGLVARLLERAADAGEIPGGDLRARLFAANALLMGALRLHPLWTGASDADALWRRTTTSAVLAIFRSDRI